MMPSRRHITWTVTIIIHTDGKVMIRYIVRPGYVISQTDGDRHYISASQLMHLYGVQTRECVILRGPEDRYKLRGLKHDLINLFPRFDGKYNERI